MKCASAGSQTNGYVYNYFVSGKSLGDISDPTKVLLTADGKVDSTSIIPATKNKNVSYSVDASDIINRHSGKVITSYADGHVEAVDLSTIKLADDSIYQFGIAPWSYLSANGNSAIASFCVPGNIPTAMTLATAVKTFNNGDPSLNIGSYYVSSSTDCYIGNSSDITKINFRPAGNSKVPILRYQFKGENGSYILFKVTYTSLGRDFNGPFAIIKNWTLPAVATLANTTGWTNLGSHSAAGTYAAAYTATMYTSTNSYTQPVNKGDYFDFAHTYCWDTHWTSMNIRVVAGVYDRL
jgi:prepilin-type processing-associated H-X9-DG protein